MIRRSVLVPLALLALAVPAAAQHEHMSMAPAPETVPLYKNLGSWTHRVTASEGAQHYFDQGLRLYYGFNHEEAIRAFKEAARLDPNCPMAWWGIAIAAGPN